MDAEKMTGKAIGGHARAKVLTHEEMSEIGKKGAESRWNVPIRKATHGDKKNPLTIGDIEIECYVLEDGTRVLSKKGFFKALGMSTGGGKKSGVAVIQSMLSQFDEKGISTKKISDSLNEELRFRLPRGGPLAHGIQALCLADICDLILEARKQCNILNPRQEITARRAEILVRGFARVGILALIDESTGYIADKEKEAYRNIFKDYIREEQRKWEKEFPDQFFDMLYKIYNLKKTKGNPSFFGHVIRKYIYQPLANSNGAILEELESKNPVVYVGGGRKYRLFQFLSERIGLPALRQHLWQVIGIGNSVDSKEDFEKRFFKAFPVITIEPKAVINEIQKLD